MVLHARRSLSRPVFSAAEASTLEPMSKRRGGRLLKRAGPFLAGTVSPAVRRHESEAAHAASVREVGMPATDAARIRARVPREPFGAHGAAGEPLPGSLVLVRALAATNASRSSSA